MPRKVSLCRVRCELMATGCLFPESRVFSVALFDVCNFEALLSQICFNEESADNLHLSLTFQVDCLYLTQT